MRLTSRRVLAAVAIASTAGIGFGPVAAASHDSEGDQWVGTPRADEYMGSRYNDSASGRGGPDAMQGHRGMDYLDGGAGWDNVSGGLRSDLIFGGAGSDLTTGGDAGDLVLEDDGDDRVNGAAGSDWILLARGSDVVQAGAGRDLLLVYGDNDPDTVQCGDGRDLVVYLERRGATDRYRGCEQKFDSDEINEAIESGEVDLPPVPPVLNTFGTADDSEAAKAMPRGPLTRQAALRWSKRQLLASTN